MILRIIVGASISKRFRMDHERHGRRRSKAPTINDVAQTAGVSIATVSALLNATSKVSPVLTQRIEAAIASVGYERNAAARSLKTGATHTIGLTVADIRNPFFTDVVATIQNVLNRAGYAVMLCSSDEDTTKQDDQIKLLLDRMVDGLIIAPVGEDEVMRRLIQSTRKPVVLIDRMIEGLGVDAVLLDNVDAVQQSVLYLTGMGHKRIGYISGPPHTTTGMDRLEGYARALSESDIGLDQSLVFDGSFSEAGGYRAAMQLLTQQSRPTALFSANNLMVIGAMRAIRDLGLLCPHDVSVASLDDFPWADIFEPRLTTIAQPVEAIGERSANLLLERLSGSRTGPENVVTLKGRLMARNSCKPLSSA